MPIFYLVLVFIVSYFIGSIPWGFIIGKSKGVDIREHGSKNIGATNVTRVIGKKYGQLCFFLDLVKGLIPSFCMSFVIPKIVPSLSHFYNTGVILAVIGVIFGHLFTIFLKFKGGKGVATGCGALIPVTPLAIIVGLICWIIIFKLSRYVSVASIVSAIVVPAFTIYFSIIGIYHQTTGIEIFIIVLGILAIIKHKKNIARLLKGTENRFQK